MKQEVCRVAISGATYAFDKLYDYDIPPELTGAVVPGVRVLIPFGRGDRTREAIVVRMAATRGHNMSASAYWRCWMRNRC